LKISTQNSVTNNKRPRAIELVRSLRDGAQAPHRRLRIGLAENVFVNHKRREATSGQADEPCMTLEVSRFQLAVGIAAVAGAALGYLIGRRNK
jgi:hypothetical protein